MKCPNCKYEDRPRRYFYLRLEAERDGEGYEPGGVESVNGCPNCGIMFMDREMHYQEKCNV